MLVSSIRNSLGVIGFSIKLRFIASNSPDFRIQNPTYVNRCRPLNDFRLVVFDVSLPKRVIAYREFLVNVNFPPTGRRIGRFDLYILWDCERLDGADE